MRSNTCVVVGDAYQGLASCAPFVTETAMLGLLRSDAPVAENVILGQGLSQAARGILAERQGSGGGAGVNAALLALTHKHDARHVLIGPPQQFGSEGYVSPLIIDDLSDRLSDHVTGSHISGMLLIEATRQLCIAALELEFSENGLPMPWGIGWNGLNTRFLAFVFPLPARVTARVIEDKSKVRPSQRSVFVDVVVEQAGQLALETRYDITLVRSSTFRLLEAKKAKQAAEKFADDGLGQEDLVAPIHAAP